MNFPKDIQNDLKFNSKKSFTIVLNSTDAINGGTTNTKTFLFDWSVLPDVNYLVRFSYIGGMDDNSTGNNNYCNVFINFGNMTNTYKASTTFGSRSSQNIGKLKINYYTYELAGAIITKQYFSADMTDNVPIYLNGRPLNNSFEVKFLSGSGVGWNTNLVNQGTLILYFEPI